MDVINQYATNSKSFFVPSGKKDIGGGVELWRGYFQSVRPGANRMLINVDVTTAMMYKSGPLIGLCLSFFDVMEPRMLAPRHGFTPRKITALAKFLSNLSIRATHNNRGRTIKSVSKAGARDLSFDFNGRRITVADYFRLEANKTLQYPDVVCVEVSGCLFTR
jgi:eukaryotic translation initiation factor 2C